MYVIYPLEELLRIYENPLRERFKLDNGIASFRSDRNRGDNCAPDDRKSREKIVEPIVSSPKTIRNRDKSPCLNDRSVNSTRFRIFRSNREKNDKDNANNPRTNDNDTIRDCNRNSDNDNGNRVTLNGKSGCVNGGVKSSSRFRTRNSTIMQNNRNTADEASSSSSINNPLRDLTQSNLNEPLKQHNGNALKLVQTVSEFAQELSGAMESHGANVRRLVDEFRSKSGETRGDAGGMRRVWENLLRQVEADATAHLDLAAVLQQQLARPSVESSFHRKLQSRKIFAHREAYEQVVSKTEEKLQRARVDYKRAYAALLTNDTAMADQEPLRRAYLEAHNAYVLQLRATNAIVERYQHQCLPTLLGEMAEVYEELSTLTCNCVSGIAEAIGERSGEQAKRYTNVAKEAQSVTATNDLQLLARHLSSQASSKKPPRRLFVAPAPPEQISIERINQVPTMRDEIVTSGSGNQNMLEDLRMEADSLNQEIGRLQESLDGLTRMQRKSAEGSLLTKVAELQEDISMKRFDLGVAQLHLAAVQAQKELFGAGEAGQPDPVSNRKMSNGSTGSNTKHKWLKAFKSLKTSSPTTPPPTDKKSLESEGGHQWREYTYRKITPCDACGQVLRGHSRQGFRCRGCKVNAHADCINTVQPTMCPSLVPKKGGGIPLLRRQKTAAPPVDDTPTGEHRRGSGGSASGTRPFGQPLMLKMRVEEPPKPPTPTIVTVSRSSVLCSVSRSDSLRRNRNGNNKR